MKKIVLWVIGVIVIVVIGWLVYWLNTPAGKFYRFRAECFMTGKEPRHYVSSKLLKKYLENNKEIKYLKPDEKISSPMMLSGGRFQVPPEENRIIAIKEADENHVKVVSRINGLTYPTVDLETSAGSYVLYGTQNGKWGAIDDQGKILVPFKFDHKTKPTGYGYYVTDGWGEEGIKRTLVDKEGNFLFPYKYDVIIPKNEKYCVAVLGDRSILINTKGEDVLGEKYNFHDVVYISDDMIIGNICKEKKHTIEKHESRGLLLDIKGHIIYEGEDLMPIQYNEYSIKFYNQKYLFAEKTKNYSKVNHYDLGDKYIIRNKKGKIVLDNVIEYKGFRNAVLCYVGRDDDWKKLFILLNEKGETSGRKLSGIDDSQTEKIDDSLLREYKNGFVLQKDSFYGFIDTKGNEIVKPDFYYKIISPEEKLDKCNYIAFSNEGKSLVLNLNTFEKKEYNKKIEKIENDGKAYYVIKKPSNISGGTGYIGYYVPIE